MGHCLRSWYHQFIVANEVLVLLFGHLVSQATVDLAEGEGTFALLALATLPGAAFDLGFIYSPTLALTPVSTLLLTIHRS